MACRGPMSAASRAAGHRSRWGMSLHIGLAVCLTAPLISLQKMALCSGNRVSQVGPRLCAAPAQAAQQTPNSLYTPISGDQGHPWLSWLRQASQPAAGSHCSTCIAHTCIALRTSLLARRIPFSPELARAPMAPYVRTLWTMLVVAAGRGSEKDHDLRVPTVFRVKIYT